MRRVGIVSFAQTHHARRRDDATPAELVYPVIRDAVERSGLARHDIGFTTAGSADVLEGRPFSFGFALDVAGAVPPIEESHVEADGAWAAYEAWMRIQAGDADSALVIAWGKSSEGSLAHVTNATLDPFYESPLGLDSIAMNALQAQVCGYDERQMADVVRRARATANPHAQVRNDADPLDSPYVVEPLRRSFLPPITDGACAMVLRADVDEAIAWIDGVAHATDGSHIGARALDDAPSARVAFARASDAAGYSSVDLAEMHACFPHHELLLRETFALNGARVNESGGPLAANPIMATGLIRLGEAATRLRSDERALAHATNGHCLQANMVWLLTKS